MATSLRRLSCAAAALLITLSFSDAQTASPASTATPAASAGIADNSKMLVVQASGPAASPAATAKTTTSAASSETATEQQAVIESGGVGVREFQGDDVGQVLRLLARQAKINMVVSETVTGTVTMRLEDVTALQAISIIVKAKGLFLDKIDSVYYIKTEAERAKEPTESDSYQFSYARAKDIAPLVASQLASKDPPQVDERTNTIFFRETRSNIDNIRKMFVQIDKPTKQVMIEARLVEVTANPRQSYGINWAGVVGGSTNPQTFKYGGSSLGTPGTNQLVNAQTAFPNPAIPPSVITIPGGGSVFNPGSPERPPTLVPKLDANGIPIQGVNRATLPTPPKAGFDLNNFLFTSAGAVGGQFAILSVPQMSATLRFLNEDADAEFLANPRVVTADNQQAKIEISRNQPVPQLNFNEQTATAVFGGFQDKKFGNTLVVRPSVNKDNFITLTVKPEISNKVGDQAFVFAGATVTSPIIDTRTLDSNVLIKSGDTLAIGGLLQDEQTKARTKVPVLGDVPILGYFFQEHLNARTKRNLLVFVTPTIIDQRYGTGLEDQVSGIHHTGEEYADPNGWRNNARGAVRLVPTSQRQLAADYAKPGSPPAPEETNEVRFKSGAKDRDF